MIQKGDSLFLDLKKKGLEKKVPPGPLLVALSGGGDSVALLHLVRRLFARDKDRVVAAHVQHHLRGRESLRDQNFVRDLCRLWGVRFRVRSVRVRSGGRDSGIEARARRLRYRALARMAKAEGAACVLTAHNANDQAETFLLNLLRGSGRDGLSGMEADRPLSDVTRRPGDARVRLLRPLLDVPKEDILFYLRSRKLAYCRDSSNDSLRYRRNWVRHKLLPLMRRGQPQIVKTLSRLAAILRAEKPGRMLEMEKMRKDVLSRGRKGRDRLFQTKPGSWKLDLERFFRYNQSSRFQFLHQAFPEAGYGRIRSLDALLRKKSRGSFCPWPPAEGFHPGTGETPQAFPVCPLRVPGTSVLRPWKKVLKARWVRPPLPADRLAREASSGKTAYFDFDKVKRGGRPVVWKARSWKKGDAFRPFGMGGRRKKLQDFFTDQKVSGPARRSVPLLTADGRILWVAGHRAGEEGRVDERSRRILRFSIGSLRK